MKYGLLTPYTSFLADERVPLHAMRANADRAGFSLEALNEVSGQGGVAQRDFKQGYMKAAPAPVPNASTPQMPVIVGTQGGGVAQTQALFRRTESRPAQG